MRLSLVSVLLALFVVLVSAAPRPRTRSTKTIQPDSISQRQTSRKLIANRANSLARGVHRRTDPSAPVLPPTPCAVVNGGFYYTSYITTATAPTEDACALLCNTTPNCGAAQFFNEGTQRCGLYGGFSSFYQTTSSYRAEFKGYTCASLFAAFPRGDVSGYDCRDLSVPAA